MKMFGAPIEDPASFTVTVREVTESELNPSVTVRTTVNTPDEVYWCVASFVVAFGVPSPKSH